MMLFTSFLNILSMKGLEPINFAFCSVIIISE